MVINDYEKNLYEKALVMKGETAQIDISVEESAEFIQSLIKIKRCNEKLYDKEIAIEKMIEESADVMIMINQMIITFQKEKEFEQMKKKKLERLEKRLNIYKKENE
jgi:hypothetical protein